jgi:hypothetical protein
MPSPFPGMDPYIEAYGDWLDFHNRFTTYCCDFLNDRLPEGYAASVDTQLKLVHAEDDTVEGRMRPDLGIHADPARAPSPSRGGASVATLEPRTLTLPVDYDEIRESSVQILRYPERRLVTHIELLSPTNKRNPGRGEYLAKHTALIHQQKVNMVEIDLLLGGERLETVEPLPAGDFYAFVTRPQRLPQVDVYAWSVRQALPPIPIPLLPPDADVPIDLAVLVNQVYDRGRYGQLIAYDKAVPKALGEADRVWTEQLASSARR